MRRLLLLVLAAASVCHAAYEPMEHEALDGAKYTSADGLQCQDYKSTDTGEWTTTDCMYTSAEAAFEDMDPEFKTLLSSMATAINESGGSALAPRAAATAAGLLLALLLRC